MKKLILLSAIAASSLMYQSASAQIHLGLHINLGGPVYTAPAPVYNDVDYYYLPDVEAYYSVSRHCYYYNDGANWVSAAYLPGAYRNYDLAHARRFEVHEARPYMHNDVYRQRYGGAERRDWNRPNDRERMYADRDRMDHNQNRGFDRNQYQRNDRRDESNYQPQQNYGRGQQAQPQQNGGGNYGRGQQAPQQQGSGNFGREQQPQQPQQGGGNYGRGSQNQQNNDRNGNFGGRGRHGI
jgi:hypothetical protein